MEAVRNVPQRFLEPCSPGTCTLACHPFVISLIRWKVKIPTEQTYIVKQSINSITSSIFTLPCFQQNQL